MVEEGESGPCARDIFGRRGDQVDGVEEDRIGVVLGTVEANHADGSSGGILYIEAGCG
jgi:hypothetical protein